MQAPAVASESTDPANALDSDCSSFLGPALTLRRCSPHRSRCMTTYVLRGFVALAAIALLAGCSTHRMAEKTRLPLHPIHETRMTNQPAPGYVATGVWRVRGTANMVYLVGTSHTVTDDEIPFP